MSAHERAAQLGWARTMALRLPRLASPFERLCAYRAIIYVLYDNVLTRQAWQLVGVFFNELDENRYVSICTPHVCCPLNAT